MSNFHIETLAIHAGQNPHGDPTTYARAVPVYRTTAYNFRDSKHGANLFGLKELGNIYARLMNPTNDVLAQRLAALEGGAAAQTLASGTAAIFFTVTNIARAGDEIVAADNLYGGTFSQFDAILPNAGIKVNFTPVNDFAAVEAAINEKTRLIFIEAVGNPALDIADIEGYAAIAKK
ncbi:MAG: O-acetylhomoserine aminocarboxypropyltransferase/cysteine synthase, partial [Kiritimatiellae bacterium]|nr:O-acetylhomoserine aminocarboxypropyltransferase/cysteine synthase [Kiritimatiellia bacterium]